MKLQFALEYRTDWGQDARVLFKVTRRKGAPVVHVFSLETVDGEHWAGEASVQEKDAVQFEYRYAIYEGDALLRQEWNGVPRIFPWGDDRLFVMQDHWKDVPLQRYIYSTAYRRLTGGATAQPVSGQAAAMPATKPASRPAAQLASHQASQPMATGLSAQPMASQMASQMSAQQNEIMYFDSTLLFRIEAPQLADNQCLALLGDLPQFGQWEPSRALMMSRGQGHEWYLSLSATGLQLPLEYKYVVIDLDTNHVEWEGGTNRTSPNPSRGGEMEVSNASMISSNMVYVVWDRPLRLDFNHWRLASAGVNENENANENEDENIRANENENDNDNGLTALIDWAARSGIKVLDLGSVSDDLCMSALKAGKTDKSGKTGKTDKSGRQPKLDEKVLASNDFKRFYDANGSWLIPYAVYCIRREEEKENDFNLWHGLSRFNRTDVDAIEQQNPRDVMHYAYIQYMRHRQLSEAAQYARSKGVVLECHISVSAPKVSVESWMEPVQPSVENADWWRSLMSRMSEYFDMVCLTGLETLSAKPSEIVESRPEGYDDMTKAEKEAYHKVWAEFKKRRETELWSDEAYRRLPMIVEASDMLYLADDTALEDMGAAAVLDQLGILPTRLHQIADTNEALFGHLEWNPYRSVAKVSTIPTAPKWLMDVIVTRLMFCPSMICELPIALWRSMDEEKISELIKRSGR